MMPVSQQPEDVARYGSATIAVSSPALVQLLKHMQLTTPYSVPMYDVEQFKVALKTLFTGFDIRRS